MYLKHFALKQYPFQLTPDTDFSCNYSGHQEALNTLLFSVGNGEGIIKIIGEVGLGKTFLCRELLNCLDDKQFIVVYIPNPDLNPLELKRTILRELQNQMPINAASDVDLTQLMFEQILYCHNQGKHVVIVIDEAQALSDESLEALRLLTNLETESRKLLQIVLFAQPELQQRLARRSLRQLNQRITFSHQLGVLDRDEISKYIAQRLIVAGHDDGELFSSGAQDLLHRVTGGTPRIVNILAHKALLAAYGKEKNKVNCWAVRQAIKDSKELVTYRSYWSWRKIALWSLLTIMVLIVASLVILSVIKN